MARLKRVWSWKRATFQKIWMTQPEKMTALDFQASFLFWEAQSETFSSSYAQLPGISWTHNRWSEAPDDTLLVHEIAEICIAFIGKVGKGWTVYNMFQRYILNHWTGRISSRDSAASTSHLTYSSSLGPQSEMERMERIPSRSLLKSLGLHRGLEIKMKQLVFLKSQVHVCVTFMLKAKSRSHQWLSISRNG